VDPVDFAELAGLVGESPGIVAVRETINRFLPRLAETNRPPPILVQGETGTGKGLLARAIHRASARRAGPFVDVNCAAIPETMLEAELFGFERGAFTDARHAKAGLFQAANHGSLFLDELGLLPAVLQGKLLTVLEDRVVRRLGSTRGEPVDVWIVAATSSDIEAAMRAGRFHDALYHRLSVLTLGLPPLRERGADILLLAEHFLERACRDHGLASRRIDRGARSTLLAYRWPGNVRELANVMERVALLTDGPMVTAEMLGLGAPGPAPPEPASESAGPLRDRVAGLEREQIAAALRQTRGNVTHAASRLGIPVNTLRYRIQKLGLGAGTPRVRGPARARAAARTAPAPAVASGVVRWQSRRVAVLQIAFDVGQSAAEGAHALEAIVAKVRSFDGRIEELAPGCVVGAFGVEAVEDAARRAAHAARAVLAAFARARAETGAPWTARVGLHVESFLLGEADGAALLDATTKRRAWTLLDALVTAAEPDSTLVSAEAAPFLDRRFEIVPVRTRDGAAYRLADTERAGFGILGRLLPFVGRAAALEALRARLPLMREGRGQVVVIRGDAGIGKSRLLHELRQHASLQGVRYLEGRCVSYGRPVAYLPFGDVLRELCGIEESNDGAALERKLERALSVIGLDARRVRALVPVLGRSDSPPEADPRALRARTFDAVQQLLVGASAQRPVVLAIEDLHWSDVTSEELLGSLIASLSKAATLVVVTHRSGYRPPWPMPADGLELSLDALSHDESLQIVRAILPAGATPESAVQAVLGRAEGNPFFLEELARALVENPALGTAGPVPATIQEVLLSRMARLAPDDQRTLQAAAVVGKDVPWVVVRELASLDDQTLRASLTRLCAAQFLREGMGSAERGHTFAHALTQEVAYGTLGAEERRALHAAAVSTMERAYAGRLDERRDQIAHHVARGEVWSKAIHYFHASLDLSLDDATAAWRAGEHAAALPRARDDLRIAQEFKNMAGQMEVQLRLGRIHHSLGDYRSAIAALRWNIGVLGDEVMQASQARVAALLSRVWLALACAAVGEREEAERSASQAVESGRLTDTYARAAAPWAAGMVALLGGAVDRALSWLTVARDASRSLSAEELGPATAAALGFAQALAGRHDEGIATLAAAVADAEARGFHVDHALRLAWWAEAERMAGNLDRAHALATRGLETARKYSERGHEAWARCVLAAIATARGEPEAVRMAAEARALAERLEMRALLARL
jgi:transcriptional regulator with AAA-type ATPase domain/tetratricopeptide (TPR) repeat protein